MDEKELQRPLSLGAFALQPDPVRHGWSLPVLWGLATIYMLPPNAQGLWNGGIEFCTGNMGPRIEPTDNFLAACGDLLKLVRSGTINLR